MSHRSALPRRGLAQAAAIAVLAGPAAIAPAGAEELRIEAEEHWAHKGAVNLYLYRKRVVGDAAARKPVLFLVHGSSFSGRGGFDLQVPGHPGYSMMEEFARAGFDVWALDHEGYGRSTRTASNSDIRSGVADLHAGFAKVEEVTGVKALMVYGQSSGAIRAGRFANEAPDRVERLILDAFTWKGDGAPEIMRRREAAATYRTNPSRAMNRESFVGIFSRDDPSTFDPAVPAALAEYELALGNTAPSGTYLDMAVNMPLVDPKRIACPVLMTRAETDGNATEAELLEFFSLLPTADRQFTKLKGVAHVAVLGTNRRRIWHVMKEFLTYPV